MPLRSGTAEALLAERGDKSGLLNYVELLLSAVR